LNPLGIEEREQSASFSPVKLDFPPLCFFEKFLGLLIGKLDHDMTTRVNSRNSDEPRLQESF